MHGLRRIVFTLALCAGLGVASGCGVDSPVQDQVSADAGGDTGSRADAGGGSEGDTVDEPDVGQPDSGSPDATEPDATEPDATEPQPESARPSAAPSAGGARLETPKHRIRLIVGPRGGAGRVDTRNHRILMGAGSVQHAGN